VWAHTQLSLGERYRSAEGGLSGERSRSRIGGGDGELGGLSTVETQMSAREAVQAHDLQDTRCRGLKLGQGRERTSLAEVTLRTNDSHAGL
jgi:hypothetical protein